MILFSQSERGQIVTDCGKRQARRGLGHPQISGPLNGSQAESFLGRFQVEKAENQNALENLVHILHALQGQGAQKGQASRWGWGGVGWGCPSLLPTQPSLSRGHRRQEH